MNPGTKVDEAFYANADLLMTFETYFSKWS